MDDLFDFGSFHSPGGKIKIPVSSSMKSQACFSDCKKARFWLSRQWQFDEGFKTIMWIGMNPSTADEFTDDPTVRKEIRLSQKWGFGKYIKTNLTPYRATNPKNIDIKMINLFAYENLKTILELAKQSDCVVACWGNNRTLKEWAEQTLRVLNIAKIPLYCLGKNANGSPKHPLYLSNQVELQPF